MSTEDSQHPKPGWEWYHPTTISGLEGNVVIHQQERQEGSDKAGKRTHRPVCLSMSSILVWKTWSTDSTVMEVPLWGMAKTSTTWTWRK